MPSTGSLLHDHHGPWCAHCLHYFKAAAEEQHHVYPQWSTGGSLAATILTWKVPVHKKVCHRKGHQRRSDAAGLTLADVLAKPEAVVRRAAEAAFLGGNLNLSLVLELELARRTRDQGNFEASCTYLLNAVAAAAGSSQERAIRCAFAGLDPKTTISRASRNVRARWALSFGNLERNFYDIGSAAARYDEAASHLGSLPTSARNLYQPAYLRRIVSLEPSLSGARKAVDSARQARDPWGQRTANLVEGWSNLAAGLASRARDCFARILWESRLPLSWWHAAETHFGLGLSYIMGSDDVRTGVGHCLRSQYIRAILGLTGDVVVGVGLGSRSLEKGLGPAEVITMVGQSAPRKFTRAQMTTLRSEFLDGELQEALFKELKVGIGLYVTV